MLFLDHRCREILVHEFACDLPVRICRLHQYNVVSFIDQAVNDVLLGSVA